MGKIRIYTSESVDIAITEGPKRRGVDIFHARDTDKLGLTDEEQLVYAGKEKAAVFTHDTDFLWIAARWMDPWIWHLPCHVISFAHGYTRETASPCKTGCCFEHGDVTRNQCIIYDRKGTLGTDSVDFFIFMSQGIGFFDELIY